jgi:hypothetical protein
MKLPELNSQDEDEMRAFYASFGMSKSTTEAAIQAMRSRRVEQKKKQTCRAEEDDDASEGGAVRAEVAARRLRAPLNLWKLAKRLV